MFRVSAQIYGSRPFRLKDAYTELETKKQN